MAQESIAAADTRSVSLPHRVLTCHARSGMLPGFVSGFYTYDECHVDLNRLAQYAGATLILAPAVDIDLEARAPPAPWTPFLCVVIIGCTPRDVLLPWLGRAREYVS